MKQETYEGVDVISFTSSTIPYKATVDGKHLCLRMRRSMDSEHEDCWVSNVSAWMMFDFKKSLRKYKLKKYCER